MRRLGFITGIILVLVLASYSFFNDSGIDYLTHTVTNYLPLGDYASLDQSNVKPDLIDLRNATMHDDKSRKRQNEPSSNQTIVIILAYMHTGSTYLGRILQHHEGTFYEYENLRSLMYSTRAGKLIHFLNGTSRQLQRQSNPEIVHHNIDPHIGAEAVSKMITCNHKDLDLATLANHYFDSSNVVNRDLAPFFKCQERQLGRSNHLNAVSALKYVENKMLYNITRAKEIIQSCLPSLFEKCKHCNIIVEKFIRMTMDMANLLLHDFENLKVIHLVRDPRAMLYSQYQKHDSGANIISTFKGRARYMCHQMLTDLHLAKELKRVYSDQIYTVRYEDIVDVNKTTIKKVFEFIGIPFTKNDKVFVERTSRQSSSKNSTKLVIPWRQNMSLQHLSIVDSVCSPLYEELGYIKLKKPQKMDHNLMF